MHDLWENSSTENPYFNDFAGWWMDRWEQIPDVWKFPDAEIPSGGSLSQAYERQFGSAETESVLEHYLNRPAMAPVTAEFRRFWQAIYYGQRFATVRDRTVVVGLPGFRRSTTARSRDGHSQT